MILLTWLEIWVFAGWDGSGEQTAGYFNSRATGLLWIQKDAFWVDQCPHHFSAVNGNLPRGSKPNWCIIHLDDSHFFFKRPSQPFSNARGHVQKVETCHIKTIKVQAVLQADQLSQIHYLSSGNSNWWEDGKSSRSGPPLPPSLRSRAFFGSLGSIVSLSPSLLR